MISNVTICPFLDADHLAQTAERGTEPVEEEIAAILKIIKDHNPMFATKLNRLDDLILGARVAVQNETIRSTICIYCDNLHTCTPAA